MLTAHSGNLVECGVCAVNDVLQFSYYTSIQMHATDGTIWTNVTCRRFDKNYRATGSDSKDRRIS